MNAAEKALEERIEKVAERSEELRELVFGPIDDRIRNLERGGQKCSHPGCEFEAGHEAEHPHGQIKGESNALNGERFPAWRERPRTG